MKITTLLLSLLATAAIALGQFPVYQYNEIEVGLGPAKIIGNIEDILDNEFSEPFYIICIGDDVEFDGVYDEGTDTKASIWKYEWGSIPEQVAEIDGYFPKFPVNVFGIGDNSFIPMTDGNVYMFDYATQTLESEPTFEIDTDAIFYLQDEEDGEVNTIEMLLTSNAVGDSEVSVFVNGFQINLDAGKYATNMNIVGGDDSGELYIATLNHDGTFQNWTVQVGKITFGLVSTWDYVSIPVGNTPNSIVLAPENDNDEAEFYVIGNGSHEIYRINSVTGELVQTIQTDTEGFGGPRDAWLINENMLVVSTYSKKTLVIDTESEVSVEFQADHFGEGLIGNFFNLAMAMPFNEDYSKNNTIAIYSYPISVQTETQYDFSISPNFLDTQASIVSEDKQATGYQVYSITGELVTEGVMINGEGVINRSSFSTPGLYRVIIGGNSEWLAVQ
jgi:WD40 repeat protein